MSAVDAKKITLVVACVLTALAAWPVRRLSSGARPQSTGWIQRPSPFLLRFLLATACWAAALGAFNPFTNVFLRDTWEFRLPIWATFSRLPNFYRPEPSC